MATLNMRASNQGQADERPYAWRLGIHNLYKNAAPLLHVMTRASKQVVSDAQFNHFEKTFPAQMVRINDAANIAAGIPVFTVDSGDATKVRKDYLLRNTRSFETVRVTADPTSATTIHVARSVGTTAAAQVNDNDYFVVLGTAHSEGDPVPTAVWYDPTKIYGALQIFRNSTDQTETARRTDMRTGPISKEARREALLLHEVDKERAFMFSEYSVSASGNAVRRTTTSLLEKITSNVTDYSGSVTRTALNSALADIFEDGSQEKLFLGGKATLLTIWNLIESMAWNVYDRTDASYGIKINEIVTPFGSLMVTHDKLLTKTTDFSDWAFILDPEHLSYRFLKGRDTELLRNRQNPGDDRVIDEYLAEVGLEVMHESTHGIFKNMTAFAG
jgi:hypothetical protein